MTPRAARRVVAPVDVAGGLLRVTGESGAGIHRPVRADGVGVLAVNLARPHVDAVHRHEPALLGLVAEDTTSSRRGSCRCRRRWTAAAARRRHARAVQRLAARADDGQRNHALGLLRLRLADDRLERDPRELVGEVLLLRKSRSAGIAVDRALVEVAADRDAALARPRARTFSMILSKVPWPPRSGRIRLCVS